MKAMILAAGLGKRMRPLTEHTPKPLLRTGDKALIEYHLENLAKTSIKEVVINTHWLAQQIPSYLGTGERWGLKIHYSHEAELLETAGGIRQALPLLVDDEDDSFFLINGDVYSELDFSDWLEAAPTLSATSQAYLALVENPEHNVKGDFAYDESSHLLSDVKSLHPHYTYSGIGLYHASFFSGLARGPAQLGPLLRSALPKQTLQGSLHKNYWMDVGTPERLDELRARLK